MPRTSRAKKRGKSLRVFAPGSGAEKSQQLMLYQRALKELVREGYVHDPALRRRIAAGWHPGIEMAVMTTQPDLPDLIRATCYKVLLDAMGNEQKLARGAAPEDFKITVVVPPWAAGPATSKALPGPDETVDETVIEPDMPRTNGSPPTPPMSEQSRLQKIVNAQRPTQIYEVPADPSKPKELVGEMSQAKGYLTKEQIVEILRKGQ